MHCACYFVLSSIKKKTVIARKEFIHCWKRETIYIIELPCMLDVYGIFFFFFFCAWKWTFLDDSGMTFIPFILLPHHFFGIGTKKWEGILNHLLPWNCIILFRLFVNELRDIDSRCDTDMHRRVPIESCQTWFNVVGAGARVGADYSKRNQSLLGTKTVLLKALCLFKNSPSLCIW